MSSKEGPSRFTGTFRPKLDEKGRLVLPAKFRDRLAEGVMVTISQDRAISVYTPDGYEVKADQVRDRDPGNAGDRGFQRMFFSHSDEQTPDKQGRISLAPVLRGYAGIERDVVVVGVDTHLEIWNADTWDSYYGLEIDNYAALDEPKR